MAKIALYVLTLAGIILLMQLAGFHTGTSSIASAFGIELTTTDGVASDLSFANANIIKSILYNAFFSLVSMFGIGFGVGYLISQDSSLALKSGFSAGLLGWLIIDTLAILSDIRILYPATSSNNWVFWICSIVFGGLLIYIIISLIQWWTGSDN